MDTGRVAEARPLTRLAVLPFRLLKPDPEIDYLGLSLADAIVSSLSGFESLVVRSMLKSAPYAGVSDLSLIASDLAVDMVLTGSLLRSSDRLRVSAELVSVPAGDTFWAQTTHVSSDAVFDLHDELAQRVVTSLPLVARTASESPVSDQPAPKASTSTCEACSCEWRRAAGVRPERCSIDACCSIRRSRRHGRNSAAWIECWVSTRTRRYRCEPRLRCNSSSILTMAPHTTITRRYTANARARGDARPCQGGAVGRGELHRNQRARVRRAGVLRFVCHWRPSAAAADCSDAAAHGCGALCGCRCDVRAVVRSDRPAPRDALGQWGPRRLEMLRVNIEGTYAVLHAAVPFMRSRGWGRIVNVSSVVAVDGAPGAGPYAAAKAALHGLTRSLARELGPAGILVNVVMPGPTLTERALTMFSTRPNRRDGAYVADSPPAGS